MKYLLLVITIAIVAVFSYRASYRQTITQQNHGVGSDGLQYLGMYYLVSGQGDFNFISIIDSNYYGYAKEHPGGIRAHEMVKGAFPFNQRVLVPLIASKMHLEPMKAFRVINISCFVLALVVLLVYWLGARKFEPVHVAMALTWMGMAFMSPLRYAFYDPFFIDGPIYLFLSLLIALAGKQKYFPLVFLLAVIALFAKESVLLIVLLCFVYHVLNDMAVFDKGRVRKLSAQSYSYGLLTIVVFAASYYYKHFMKLHYDFSFKSSFAVAFVGLRYVFSDPTPFVRYACAILFGFSMLFYAGAKHKSGTTQMDQNSFLCIALLFMTPLLGSDILRYMMNWTPVVFTWILMRLNKKDILYHLLLFVFSLPLIHIFAPIPDPMNIHPSSDADGFNDMYGYHSWQPQAAHMGLIAAYLCYAVVFIGTARLFKNSAWYERINSWMLTKLTSAQ